MSLTYDERQALVVIRRAIKREPDLILELMEGQSREMARTVLLQAKTELDQLLEVNRAFIAASSRLVKPKGKTE
jgi:hypothetical protein